MRGYRAANPDRQREYWIRCTYGLEPEDLLAMYETQRGCCAVCRTNLIPPGQKVSRQERLNVDHCHITGKVRGLLCMSCNTGLGMLGDDPDRLRAALRYLNKHRPS